MAQKVTHRFAEPDSTQLMNYHVAKLLSKGPYSGMMVEQATPATMFVNLTPGYAFTVEGVKIEEVDAVPNFVEIPAADATFDRKDLIVLTHQYVAGPTVPAGNYATYRVIQGDLPSDLLTTPVAPYDQMTEYEIPLCEVWLPHGATFVEDGMLHNLRRTMTTSELQDELAEALYIALGNFAFEGWDAFDAGGIVLGVTEGRGLLCGKLNKTVGDSFVHTLRTRSFLRPEYDPLFDPGSTVLYKISSSDPGAPASSLPNPAGNLSLQEQPDFPSIIRFTITTTTEGTSGNIYVSGNGVDPAAPPIVNHAVAVNQGPNEVQTYETSVVFTNIPIDSIDVQELQRSGTDIMIYIKDRPIHYIYAVGTPTGVPYFRAEMNPMYQPMCHEMLIAEVETDETQIISIKDYSVGALVPITERLFPPCDGVTRVFYTNMEPKPGTLQILNDGVELFSGLPFQKGFIQDGKKITLEANVPTPDANTVLMARYTRFI